MVAVNYRGQTHAPSLHCYSLKVRYYIPQPAIYDKTYRTHNYARLQIVTMLIFFFPLRGAETSRCDFDDRSRRTISACEKNADDRVRSRDF